MKWYEKQKKLFAEQQQEGTADNIKDETMKEEELVALQEEDLKQDWYEESPKSDEQEYLTIEDSQEHSAPCTVLETKIQSGTMIQGNLETKGDLYVSGIITGDVMCDGLLHVENGSIFGNIHASNIHLENAKIQGDIICLSAMKTLDDSNIVGDIKAKELYCSGFIKGDLQIDGDLRLSKTAKIEGSVVAKNLQSDKGASMKGQCNIISD